MAVFGADIEALRQLGDDLSSAADRIRQLATRIDGEVQLIPAIWHGQDGAEFVHLWQSRHRPTLTTTADSVAEAADTVHRNAADQQLTSTADGAGVGPGTGGGSPIVVAGGPGGRGPFGGPGGGPGGFVPFSGPAPAQPVLFADGHTGDLADVHIDGKEEEIAELIDDLSDYEEVANDPRHPMSAAEAQALQDRVDAIDAEIAALGAANPEQPPSALDVLSAQRREAELRRERDGLELHLDRYNDPVRFEAVLGIKQAHAESLLAEAALIDAGLTPDSTTFYDTELALGTVYLNEGNRATIEDFASTYGIAAPLLAGTIAAEYDFDYEAKNRYLRDLPIPNFPFPLPGGNIPAPAGLDQSLGPANVHRESLEYAINYLVENDLPGADQAAAYPINDDLYRSSFDGSAEGAAIVTAMYDHAFGGATTSEEQAAVWAAYRSGVGDFANWEGQPDRGGFASIEEFQDMMARGAPDEYPHGNNATISEPLFDFLNDQYDKGEHPNVPRPGIPEQPPTGTTTTTPPTTTTTTPPVTTPPAGGPPNTTTTTTTTTTQPSTTVD